jgi:ribosome-associated toxin RatA of RatAB toxin-antitoxin module
MGNSVYTLSVSRELRQSADEAFRIVEELDRFPEFMPSVVSIRILEASGNRKVAEWDTRIDNAPLVWIEEGIYDKVARIVRFRSIEGVFDRFDGTWEVQPRGEGCSVSFELTYEIGLPEIEEYISPILRERLLENVESMMTAIEKRAQGQ